MLSKKPSELELAVLDAIKLQLVDTFKKVSISCAVEEREVVIRISIPEEIMQVKKEPDLVYDGKGNTGFKIANGLDQEANDAANELLGLQ
jgi:hypothetical protein